jgi:uncharacterized membrane protein
MIIPMMAVIVPLYIIFFITLLSTMPQPHGNAPPNAAQLWSFFGSMAVFYLLLFVAIIVVSIPFVFVYPLIVDRGLNGVDAVKVSFRATFANLGGVAGLVLLNAALSLVGVMCCYVGAFFVLPISFAAILTAFRQVFPDPDLPPSA